MNKDLSKLAIYFPDIGYHCDKPLLYYSRSLARELGYKEYRNISYTRVRISAAIRQRCGKLMRFCSGRLRRN